MTSPFSTGAKRHFLLVSIPEDPAQEHLPEPRLGSRLLTLSLVGWGLNGLVLLGSL